MDRLSGDLDHGNEGERFDEAPAIPLKNEADDLLARSEQRLAVPQKLFNLAELDVLYDADHCALWTFMHPSGRPTFTPSILTDFEQWQDLIAGHFGPDQIPLRYLILGSRAPGVFCFGGDLKLFHALILDRNRKGLVAYGRRCVEILNRNYRSLDLPMLTVGLVQGQALGGGFEALLSFDFIVAEKGATFGLPEITFGLFPGMGAHPILSRKLGTAVADRLILGNETFTAEQMFDMGIVHRLAEPGEGIEAMRDFMAKSDRRHAGMVNARKAMRVSAPISMEEYYEIVDLWADAALQLREHDLKLMQRLASAQERLIKAS
ncbi:MAG: crotonase/enoyl-CoA hydratase family protein [Novosphingobium sp.]|nr:crotonase/enoyl-CoA hydratase family protein [Novosphingobium sp.]MCP5402431.1 crotonase/enoyl-CoA hydratase family protein [Novosphingobium sp.]